MVLVNRAWVNTSTVGTGDIDLGSALPGYFTFAEAGVQDADVVPYCAKDGNDFEIGTGTYTASGTTLTRTVTESKIGGVAGTSTLNLSGNATVFITARAEDIVNKDGNNDVTGIRNLTQTGYLDLTEISEPASPAANALRIYAVDDGAGVSMLSAKDSSGNVLPITHFTQAGTGAVTRTAQAKQREFITIVDFGGVGDDATSNTTAIANARTAAGADRPVYLLSGDYNVSETTNLYNSVFADALGLQILVGTEASPATRHEAVLWIEKVSESTRDVISGAWDQGAIYASLDKRDGDAYGAAITGYAVYSGGEGDLVGIHGRARIDASGGQAFAGWFYTTVTTATPGRVAGIEININNDGADPGWEATAASGAITALNIAMGDSDFQGTHGIRFPQQTHANGQQFWTGLQFDQNSISAVDGSGNGEAIRIRGGTETAAGYGGIAFGDATGSHHYYYGIRMRDATFNSNTAIWLATNHRIQWNDIGSNFCGITSPATDFITFHGGNSEHGRLASSGNWGFGTVATAHKVNIGVNADSDTASNVLRLIQNSGASAVGAGRGVNISCLIATQSNGSNSEVGGILRCIATDVTAASEDFDWRFLLMTAGAAASEKLRIQSAGMMQIWDGSALVQVSVGDDDSGGGGFRLLRVPN